MIQNIQNLAMQMGAMPPNQNQFQHGFQNINQYDPEYFEEDDEGEEGEIGQKVIIDPTTGEELGIVKTMGTRPKGYKPTAEEY